MRIGIICFIIFVNGINNKKFFEKILDKKMFVVYYINVKQKF